MIRSRLGSSTSSSRPGVPWRALVLGLLMLPLFVAVGWGCARAGSPEGGPIPETPLGVVATSPDTFAVVDPFDDPVAFQFDRRPSERPTDGQLRDAVVVSPRTGEVSVRHRRHGLEVRMDGGFQDRTVYRITLLPTIQDLWQNRLGEPYDLFFSTGPDFEPNILGGLVTDRLTLEEAAEVRVDAESLTGGPTHSTVTDSTGIFTFPYLPADRYMVRAYEDQNRNREADFAEPQDSLEVEISLGDTLIVTELALLLPDTTPAILESVEAPDSTTLRLTFDDPLDPEMSLEGIRVSLTLGEGNAPGVRELLHLHEWEQREAERAEREAAEREAEEEEDEPEDPEPPPVEDPEPPPPAPEPEADGPLLPGFELVALLDGPLEPEATYRVQVEGVRNLNGVPGGGGEIDVEGPLPPEDPAEDEEEEPGEGDPDEEPPGGGSDPGSP